MENEKSSLEELLKKQLTTQRLLLAVGIILAVLFGVLTASIVKLSGELAPAVEAINAFTEEINELMPTLKETVDSIAAVSESLNDEGLPKLYETLENLEGLKKLENINIDELNGAISGLYSVVEPLAKLFGK